ncbi:DUF2934 domain-containing protein [Caballeronia telluris]|uniref:DUF2934 domain-containing protein n=1 Tax=Caballeronia telluris TaxID=326475 RepID=UPI002E15D9F8
MRRASTIYPLSGPALPTEARRSRIEPLTIDERIRLQAYELWPQDGSMEGCADEYW